MNNLPQVGQKYQHKKWGEVIIMDVAKIGRGYQVRSVRPSGFVDAPFVERLKEFQKATS